MKKVKLTFTAKQEMIVNFDEYPKNFTIDDILAYEKRNIDNGLVDVDFGPEQVTVKAELC